MEPRRIRMIYAEVLHKLNYNKFLVFEGHEVMRQGEYTGSEWFKSQMYHVGTLCLHACMCAKPFQSCLTLCDTLDCSPPGSFVHGIFQARVLEWVTVCFSGGSSQPKDLTCVSCISCTAGGFFIY